MPAHHAAFSLLRSEAIPSLNLTIEEYQHNKTGAQHIHLQSDNNENVFLVALRTVPHDSTGVAHILEHTALCGSEKYPVRDPFFMMTRRSLNTFMNAFTSSDWTAYPFASTNRKDFDNLLNVYLDAVFFSRLDPLDFAQEGHRLEFAEPTDPKSELQYKGVVYNEMKGAMSSINSMLWHTLGKYLHPSTTYHYNSGGEPDCIPDLSYEELLHFYKTHYHPSNAIFMTYGNISAEEHQTKFESQALHRFDALEEHIHVPDEKRYFAPLRVEEAYPLNEAEDNGKKTHVVMGWLLGKSADLQNSLAAQLVASILLDNSASPLMHALETTDLGNAPSPLCGLDDSHKELTFVCGLEGCALENSEAVEAHILSVLEKLAKEGIPQEDIEASLHQLELHQREIGGDHYPYGLQIILSALTAATHRGDPVAMLNVDKALNDLREAIKDPNFVQNQIQKLFLDNPHRVTLSLRPDGKLNTLKEAAEKAKLAEIKSQLSEQDVQAIIEKAQALEARQNQKDDESILPKVTLADVPPNEAYLKAEVKNLPQSKRKLSTYKVGSNGLVYQQVVVDMPDLNGVAKDDSTLRTLPFYTSCVSELGIGQKSYMEVQKWQAQVSGSLNAFSNVRCTIDDIHQTNHFVTFSGKALVRNHKALSELMHATMTEVRFDEHARVRELVAQMRASREQSVTGSGHSLAMLAAASGQCAANLLSHNTGGLAGIQSLKALDDRLNDPAELTAFCDKLADIHQQIAQADKQFLLIGEAHQLPSLSETFADIFDSPSASSQTSVWQLEKHSAKVEEAWLTNSQVNFCAKSYPTVSMTHPDAAALVVLANVLRNGYLHRAIREQGGAYGGGASQDNNSACFRFYSYRDPRLADTLADFDKAIAWVAEEALEWQSVEEAILGVVSGLDKPDSPAGAAKRFFHADLHGRTLERRQAFREQLLATQIEDIKRVAETYFTPEFASTAVVTDHSKEDLVTKLGLKTIKL